MHVSKAYFLACLLKFLVGTSCSSEKQLDGNSSRSLANVTQKTVSTCAGQHCVRNNVAEIASSLRRNSSEAAIVRAPAASFRSDVKIGTKVDVNDYVEVLEGSLNMVITVPHGGLLTPDGFEVRKPGCYSRQRGCTYSSVCRAGSERNNDKCRIIKGIDNNTYEMALQLRNMIEKLTGRAPYFVANRLSRSRLDPNRQIDEATSMNLPAITAYRRYHGAIDNAVREVQKRFPNGAFVVDIHGHNHSHNYTELGYGIAPDLLDAANFSATTDGSLQLIARNYQNLSASANVVTGFLSLGAFLEEQNLKALPSPRKKRPNGIAYFSGAYTVKTYGTVRRRAAAVQVEIPHFFRMAKARKRYLQRLARGLKNFLLVHLRFF